MQVGVQGLGGEVTLHSPNDPGGIFNGLQSRILATALSFSFSLRGGGIISLPGFVPSEHFKSAPSTTNFLTINFTSKLNFNVVCSRPNGFLYLILPFGKFPVGFVVLENNVFNSQRGCDYICINIYMWIRQMFIILLQYNI